VRTEAESDSDDPNDDSDDEQNQFNYHQQIFFTDGGRTVKVMTLL
jgi:hypothetical protein